ncbi:MAG: TRAP transporter permease [Thermodesulfobacteriota bacterium]
MNTQTDNATPVEVGPKGLEGATFQVEEFETQPRKLARIPNLLLMSLMIGLSIFTLFTSWHGPFTVLIQRSIHLFFVLPAAFLIYPAFRKSPNRNQIPVIDVVIMVLAAIASLWITFNAERIQLNPGWSIPMDIVLAPIMILIVLEATRRILGLAIPAFLLFLIVYAFMGPYLPGRWSHRGFTIRMILETIYVDPSGLFGFILGISATVIAGFLIFGVVLSKTGGSDTFVDLAKMLAGRSVGGPAKVSCFSSAFFGTVSGSAVANVVVDGIFNIPLMKKLGYRKEFAGAVEAVTSAGGQFVPPVMGASAFIIAEVLGIPYAKVAFAAIIPSLLYYTGCFMGIHFWAQKYRLETIPPELIPKFKKDILPQSAPFFIPVTVLIYFLTIGWNPSRCVFYTIVISACLFLILRGKNKKFSDKLKDLIHAMDEGGRLIVVVAVLCACAQMVIGMLNATGFGIKLSEMIIDLSGGNVLAALVLTSLVTILLGLGVPSVAAYVVASAVCVQPLLQMGLEPLPAHMFIFYFSVLAVITPPVCPSVYVAAAIAKSNWLSTAWYAVRLGIAGYIVPFMFYYAPSLLLKGSVYKIIIDTTTAFLGVTALAAATMGYLGNRLNMFHRTVVAICALVLISPSPFSGLAALAVLIVIYMIKRHDFKRESLTGKDLQPG